MTKMFKFNECISKIVIVNQNNPAIKMMKNVKLGKRAEVVIKEVKNEMP